MLGSQFRRAVERARALERESLGDAARGGARATSWSSVELEAGRSRRAERRSESRRVDAARREEDKLRALPAAELEARVRADEVRPYHAVEPAAVGPCHDRRLRGAFDDRVDWSDGAQVVATRTSPCTKLTPPRRSRGRLSSEPRRWRLSNAVTSQPSWRAASPVARFAPIKPAPPVTSTLMERVGRRPGHGGERRRPGVESSERSDGLGRSTREAASLSPGVTCRRRRPAAGRARGRIWWPVAVRILVLTTSYPRDADDVAGTFVRDGVQALRDAGVEVRVVSPASFRHYGIAYGDGIVNNLRRRPWKALALPLFLLSFHARRGGRRATSTSSTPTGCRASCRPGRREAGRAPALGLGCCARTADAPRSRDAWSGRCASSSARRPRSQRRPG